MTIQEILDSLPRKSISGGIGGSYYSLDDKDGDWVDVDAAEKAIKQAWNSALDLAAEKAGEDFFFKGAIEPSKTNMIGVERILNLKIK